MARSATPILDLQAPLKKPAISLTLMGLLKALPAAIGLIALFMGILIFVFTHNIQVPHWLGEGFSPLAAIDNLFEQSPFEASLWLLLLMFLATLVHETGHATAALFLKWDLIEFRVLPLSIQKKNGRWTAKVSLNYWPTACVSAYPAKLSGFHSNIRLFALAGPMANLATGTLAVLIHSFDLGPKFSAVLAIFMIWSFFLGVFNLLPLRMQTFEVDGYIAFVGARNPRWLAMRVAAIKLARHIHDGKPVQSMNRKWIALAESPERASWQNRVGIWLAYCYWLEQKNFDRAALMLEKLLLHSDRFDEAARGFLFAECSVSSAHQGEKLRARAWKERSAQFATTEYFRRRSNSFVAWVEGDSEQAYQEALLAKDAIFTFDVPDQEAALRIWSLWIEDLDKQRKEMKTDSTSKPDQKPVPSSTV